LNLRNGAGSLVMMPIGVPKVAYRVPGSGSADWVDIYNRLYRERIIFLGQEIDDDYANQIIGVLLVGGLV
jgi:ATP-dependent protease ClpP protease subunit